MRQGIILASNNSGAAATPGVFWPGGYAALVVSATAYPSTCALQYLAQDSTTWINIVTGIAADVVGTAYALPAGLYRMNLAGGTVAALYANIVSVVYS